MKIIVIAWLILLLPMSFVLAQQSPQVADKQGVVTSPPVDSDDELRRAIESSGGRVS